MRIIVASVRTPFVSGGAEVLADGLIQALRNAGHEAELVALPFNASEPDGIPDQMLACALFDLEKIHGAQVDLVIGLKFPAYLIPHSNKVLWILHQHRQAYDMWERPLGDLHHSPHGTLVRDIIRRADVKACAEAKAIFTLSENVSRRLRDFCKVESTPLYHPPAESEKFYCADQVEDYIFFPSRISASKRQELCLHALSKTRNPVRLKFAGTADSPAYGEQLVRLARQLGVEQRVEWTGVISESQKRDLYARALAVLFPPFDEDYGYITLEAMLASKPVITCNDAGGPLEFVIPDKTGLVTAADPKDLAAGMDALWQDRALAKQLGRAGRDHYDSLGLSWNAVVKSLVG